jgi:hypothetical protein
MSASQIDMRSQGLPVQRSSRWENGAAPSDISPFHFTLPLHRRNQDQQQGSEEQDQVVCEQVDVTPSNLNKQQSCDTEDKVENELNLELLQKVLQLSPRTTKQHLNRWKQQHVSTSDLRENEATKIPVLLSATHVYPPPLRRHRSFLRHSSLRC